MSAFNGITWDEDEEDDWFDASCMCSNCSLRREAAKVEEVVSNINKSKEQKMDTSAVGTRFFTGNEVINSLPAGTILEVTHVDGNGQAEVEVIDVLDSTPELLTPVEQAPIVVTFSVGDRINTKYGPATVVGVSSRLEVNKGGSELDTEKYLLYVADKDPIVRRLRRDEATSL